MLPQNVHDTKRPISLPFPRRTYVIMTLLYLVLDWKDKLTWDIECIFILQVWYSTNKFHQGMMCQGNFELFLLYNLIFKGHKGNGSYHMSKTQVKFFCFCGLELFSSIQVQISSDRECHPLCFMGTLVNQCQRNCFIFFQYLTLIKYSV